MQYTHFLFFLFLIHVSNIKFNCSAALTFHCGCINADRQPTTEFAVQAHKEQIKEKKI